MLDEVWARHIGDAATLDYVIKQGILEGRRREEIILYAPPGGRIGNRFLMQQLAAHLRLVERPDDLPFDAAAVQALHYHYQFPRLPDGSTVFSGSWRARSHQRWHKDGRGPLLELPPDIAARGRALLQAAGVPRGAWFVALHVRDIAWKGLTAGMQAIRNADTAAYLPAITDITRRGGFVVRMGDPDAPPLPPLANVIDYCRSDIRSDWMDIFLMARSRFARFGVGPDLRSAALWRAGGADQLVAAGMRPWHASDIFLPKLPRRLADGRYLTLTETLREPLAYCHSPRYLATHEGVHVEDNDPELIRGAVAEMLLRLDGNAGHDADVAELRARADRIYQGHGHFGMARLGTDFLRRHGDFVAYLLSDQTRGDLPVVFPAGPRDQLGSFCQLQSPLASIAHFSPLTRSVWGRQLVLLMTVMSTNLAMMWRTVVAACRSPLLVSSIGNSIRDLRSASA